MARHPDMKKNLDSTLKLINSSIINNVSNVFETIEVAIFTKIGLGWVFIHFWWVLICADVLFQFLEFYILYLGK